MSFEVNIIGHHPGRRDCVTQLKTPGKDKRVHVPRAGLVLEAMLVEPDNHVQDSVFPSTINGLSKLTHYAEFNYGFNGLATEGKAVSWSGGGDVIPKDDDWQLPATMPEATR